MRQQQRTNATMQKIEEELKESFENLSSSNDEIQQRFQNTIDTFSDFEKFSKDASEPVEYYFSKQSVYKKKGDFLCYLKNILTLYTAYLGSNFSEEDEEIENIIEFIEDNYDFLIYFGEKVNPISRRLNNPNSYSIRKQLNKAEKKRLISLLLYYKSYNF